MSIIEEILARRSIRRYTHEAVSEEDLEDLLRAAMSAPSAGNEQPWHFVVIRDRELREAIPAIHPYAAMAAQAPLVILVCGDESLEKYKGFWTQDCAAATENLLLAAQSKGLGAVWVGLHPVEERANALRQLLGIPPQILPFSLVPIGHPDEKKLPSSRFDWKRVHFDRWSEP